MEGKPKAKQYKAEDIARAIRLCETSTRPVAEVARDLGVEYATLYGWMKKAGKTKKKVSLAIAAPPVVPSTETRPEVLRAEIDRLHRELEETKKRLEFAKKAAAFFASNNE